ncbi:hypothetical protein [Numidum massiliense]|uniref:hypothetical protein n=1 Tax=Numidum massiliense TaxID=1522315 RepID=UPI0012F9D194|nr:hypothetical protein [Numidum massiliense]
MFNDAGLVAQGVATVADCALSIYATVVGIAPNHVCPTVKLTVELIGIRDGVMERTIAV